MTWRPAVVVVRAARAVCGLWPDRNPLRRTIDRVEAVVAGGLVAAFMAGAPLAAVAAGHAAYSIGSRTAYAQQAAWRQVSAVLLATAPAAGYRQYQVTVQAWWTAPDGTRHTGTVLAPPGTKAGCTVMVWADTAGRANRRPAAPAFAGAGPGGAGHHAHPPCSRLHLAMHGPHGPCRAGTAAAGRLGRGLAGNRTAVDQGPLSPCSRGNALAGWRAGAPPLLPPAPR